MVDDLNRLRNHVVSDELIEEVKMKLDKYFTCLIQEVNFPHMHNF